jgi:hypothetical protein
VRLGVVILGHRLIHVPLLDVGTRPGRLIHRTLRVIIIHSPIVLLRGRSLLIKSPEIRLGARLRHNSAAILLVIQAELPLLLHQELLMLLT